MDFLSLFVGFVVGIIGNLVWAWMTLFYESWREKKFEKSNGGWHWELWWKEILIEKEDIGPYTAHEWTHDKHKCKLGIKSILADFKFYCTVSPLKYTTIDTQAKTIKIQYDKDPNPQKDTVESHLKAGK